MTLAIATAPLTAPTAGSAPLDRTPLNWLVQAPATSQSIAEQAPPSLFQPVTPQRLMGTVVAIVLAWLLLDIARRLSHWLSENVARRFRLIVKQSLPFVQGLIFLLITLYLIRLWIVFSNANLIAVGGSIALALGFAFKDFASSIVAGLMALYEASYRVGDRVQIRDWYGEVVGFGLRSIRLRTPDDNIVTIPHSAIWSEAVSNGNDGALEAQVVTDFYLDNQSNIQAAVRILHLAAYTSKYTQLKLPIVVVISEHPWYTHLKLKCYPMDARNEFAYKTDLLVRAKRALEDKNISYPRNVKPLRPPMDEP